MLTVVDPGIPGNNIEPRLTLRGPNSRSCSRSNIDCLLSTSISKIYAQFPHTVVNSLITRHLLQWKKEKFQRFQQKSAQSAKLIWVGSCTSCGTSDTKSEKAQGAFRPACSNASYWQIY